MEMPQDKAQLIEVMKSGMATQFWAIIARECEVSIKFLEAQIISKTSLEPGHDGAELSEAECDRLRDKRKAMEDLMNMPQQMIADVMREDEPEDDYDPYFHTVGEVRHAEATAKMQREQRE